MILPNDECKLNTPFTNKGVSFSILLLFIMIIIDSTTYFEPFLVENEKTIAINAFTLLCFNVIKLSYSNCIHVSSFLLLFTTW